MDTSRRDGCATRVGIAIRPDALVTLNGRNLAAGTATDNADNRYADDDTISAARRGQSVQIRVDAAA